MLYKILYLILNDAGFLHKTTSTGETSRYIYTTHFSDVVSNPWHKVFSFSIIMYHANLSVKTHNTTSLVVNAVVWNSITYFHLFNPFAHVI